MMIQKLRYRLALLIGGKALANQLEYGQNMARLVTEFETELLRNDN